MATFHSTGRYHVDGLAVAEDGRIAVATSSLTGDVWDGQLLLLRSAAGSAAADVCASIPTSSGNTAVVWAGPGLLASADDLGDVRLWRFPADAPVAAIEGMRPIASYRDHEQSVSCLASAPGGLRLASGSQDGTVKVWASNNSSSQAELSLVHTSPSPWCDPGISGVAFASADTVVSVAADGLLRLWDLRAATPAVRCVAREGAGLCCVAPINDTLVVVGTQAGEVIAVDWRNDAAIGNAKPRAGLGNGPIRALCAAPGAALSSVPLVAAADDSGRAYVLEASGLALRGSVSAHADGMSAVGWMAAPSGTDAALVSGGWDKRVLTHAMRLSAC